MVENNNQVLSRRNAMKAAGVTISTGMIGLAGCTSGGESDGGGGSDGGSDGDSGSDGGSTGGTANTDITLAMGPGGLSGLVMKYISEDTAILADEMDAEGYNIEIQYTYDDVNLLAAGQNEFGAPGPLDAARLANQRNVEISLLSKNVNMFPGWMTTPGSEFDPDEVGGLEQAVTNIAENARWGVARWEAVTVPASQSIFRNYGYELQREGGDVNLTIGGFEAMAEAIIQGNLDVVSSSPDTGTVTYFLSDPPELKFVLHLVNELKRYGIGVPTMNSWGTRPGFLESDPGASRALLSAWDQGLGWFFSSPRDIMLQEEIRESFGATTEAEADYLYRLYIENSLNLSERLLVEDFRWNDQLVDESQSVLTEFQNVGSLGDGWQDNLHYVTDI